MESDKHLNCRDCSTAFVWTVAEQQFFESKNFKPPARCKSCRQSRKAAQLAAESKGK